MTSRQLVSGMLELVRRPRLEAINPAAAPIGPALSVAGQEVCLIVEASGPAADKSRRRDVTVDVHRHWREPLTPTQPHRPIGQPDRDQPSALDQYVVRHQATICVRPRPRRAIIS